MPDIETLIEAARQRQSQREEEAEAKWETMRADGLTRFQELLAEEFGQDVIDALGMQSRYSDAESVTPRAQFMFRGLEFTLWECEIDKDPYWILQQKSGQTLSYIVQGGSETQQHRADILLLSLDEQPGEP